jgi:DNA-directed RNA polymerase subunit L
MNLKIVDEDKNKLKIEVKGESETLTNVIADFAGKEGVDAAAVREHPFMEEPKILVVGSNPKKALKKAAQAVQEKTDELKNELQKNM